MHPGTMQPIWQPTPQAIEHAQVTQFARHCARRHRVELERYEDFHRWSVEHPAEFWSETWDWCGVLASKKGSTVLLDGERMPGAKWFPEARLNFAQNLLRRGDRGDALVFWDETGFRRRLSYSELTSEVSRAAQALQQLGLRDGDRFWYERIFGGSTLRWLERTTLASVIRNVLGHDEWGDLWHCATCAAQWQLIEVPETVGVK